MKRRRARKRICQAPELSLRSRWAYEFGDAHGNVAHACLSLLRCVASPCDEFERLFASGGDWQIDEAALDFCPPIARVALQAIGVFVKGLVQDANEDQTAFAAGNEFGQV